MRAYDDGLSPDQRKRAGIIWLMIGAVCWIAAASIIGEISSDRRAAAASYAEGADACVGRLQALGGQVVQRAGRIVWRKPGDNFSGETRIGEISVAAVACPGWTMVHACLGEACDGGQPYSITLAPLPPDSGMEL